MTDFLARLVARISQPAAGLRPNTPSRFAPTLTLGLAGPPGLSEWEEEREMRAPPAGPTHSPIAADPLAAHLAAPVPGATGVPPATPATARSAPAPEPAPTVRPAPRITEPPGASPTAPSGDLPIRLAPLARSPMPEPPNSASPRPPSAARAETTTVAHHHHHHHTHITERLVPGTLPSAGQNRDPAAARPAASPATPLPGVPQRVTLALPPASPASPQQAAPVPPAGRPDLRRTARPPREPAPEPPPPPAPVVVRIDRLEVRVIPPRAAPAADQRPAQPTVAPAAAPDLERFLSNLDGRRS